MITNKQNLPGPIVRAIENDGYSATYNGKRADISVTSLIDSPRIVALKRQYRTQIVEDAADLVWALLGQATHSVIERAATGDDIAEKRLYAERKGWTISGQFDLLSEGTLTDFKITSVWSVIDAQKNGKPAWDAQLNVLDWLCRKNGLHPMRAQIVALIRDWSKNKAHEDGYPGKQVVTIPIELWPEDRQERFVLERIEAHQRAHEELPLCTAEDQWRRPEKWAVMKKGQKRAVRLLDSESEAHEYAKANDLEAYTLQYRPGDAVRCSNYCSVAEFCEQRKAENGTR